MHQLHDAAELPQRARATIGVGKETCYSSQAIENSVCVGAGATAGASHWGGEIHQLSHLEALGGSTTWKLSISAGHNGPFREFRLVLRLRDTHARARRLREYSYIITHDEK